jgi:hypothetical protein
MKRVAWMTTVCLLLTSLAYAQSVEGDWTTSLRARDGQIITLTLKTEGSRLTGTLFGFRTIPLEGSIEGNALKIKLKVPATGGELIENYTATLEGGELQFTYQPEHRRVPSFGPAALKFTAKRI